MYRTLSAASLAVLLGGVAAPALAQSAPDWSGPYIGVYGGVVENNEDAGGGEGDGRKPAVPVFRAGL